MRYQNWDVLMFPEGTKVPIQEFKTQCFVLRDIDDPTFLSRPVTGSGRDIARLPVLTTFIPSMVADAQFRISIHCWDGRPKPSKALESLMQADDVVAFEARVYIDGSFVSASVMSQYTSWPFVIEQSVLLDREGQPAPLQFPFFHQEILHQSHWDAGELLGRIRVVLAEGFHYPKRQHPFEHVKDILAFSFQHAPLHILEFSGIAWPNPGMWNSRVPHYSRQFPPRNENEDLHAHSPTRHQDHSKRHDSGPYAKHMPLMGTWNFATSGGPPPPGIPWHVADYLHSTKPNLVDPFVDAEVEPLTAKRGGARANRSTIDDVSMPDYATSMSSGNKVNSRTISHMSGISGPSDRGVSKVQGSEDPMMNELSEMYKAFSPNKMQIRGATAPRNTPVTAASSAGAEKRSMSGKGPRAIVQSPTLVDSEEHDDGPVCEGKRKRTESDSPKDCRRGGSGREATRAVDEWDEIRRAEDLATGVAESSTKTPDSTPEGHSDYVG